MSVLTDSNNINILKYMPQSFITIRVGLCLTKPQAMLNMSALTPEYG